MSEREVIERVWKAPLQLVWDLWTTAEGIASWFGPRGWIVEVEEIDLREGGTFRFAMQATSPETIAAMEQRGQPAKRVMESTITEVSAPHRFAYDSPMGPAVMTTSVEFSEVEGGVKMVLTVAATKDGMLKGAMMGWNSSLGRFEEQLA